MAAVPMTSSAWNSAPLNEHDCEGDIVENDSDVECSEHLVKDSGNFVESRSLTELDVIGSVVAHRSVVHHGFQRVLCQGFEI